MAAAVLSTLTGHGTYYDACLVIESEFSRSDDKVVFFWAKMDSNFLRIESQRIQCELKNQKFNPFYD